MRSVRESSAKRRSGQRWQYEEARSGEGLSAVVAKNLKRFRVTRGLSLERLAQVCGVSRAMLGQIELSQSVPTVTVLWKIATAFEVPFSALISASGANGAAVVRRGEARTVSSEDGRFASRALFPFDQSRGTEFYELTLAPSASEVAQPHAAGTSENLVVAEGLAEIEVNGERVELHRGDSLSFHADQPHAYRNLSATEPAVLYLVMTYSTAT